VPLTASDLDEFGADALRADDPQPWLDRLVRAIDDGDIADPAADTGYALSLAADLAERTGDLESALGYSARAVEHTDPQDAPPMRAVHAGLLLRAQRGDEGMALLGELRPLLTRDADVVDLVVEALLVDERADVAEQWTTAALLTVLQRIDDRDDRADRDHGADAPTSESDEDYALADTLARRRHTLRRVLDLPRDDYDELAEAWMAASPDDVEPVLFWPQALFEALLDARPDLAEDLGSTWTEHRAGVESILRADSEDGVPTVTLEFATPAMLAATVDGNDEATDYLTLPTMAWPPGRNAPCWCGSTLKYKKCCLPRTR